MFELSDLLWHFCLDLWAAVCCFGVGRQRWSGIGTGTSPLGGGCIIKFTRTLLWSAGFAHATNPLP